MALRDVVPALRTQASTQHQTECCHMVPQSHRPASNAPPCVTPSQSTDGGGIPRLSFSPLFCVEQETHCRTCLCDLQWEGKELECSPDTPSFEALCQSPGEPCSSASARAENTSLQGMVLHSYKREGTSLLGECDVQGERDAQGKTIIGEEGGLGCSPFPPSGYCGPEQQD